MRGYWNRPQRDGGGAARRLAAHGRRGQLDAEGYLSIPDRLKDVIVPAASNVYPRMVERVLEAHPAVAEVAVIGVPDARWGESVKAVVVLRAASAASRS